LKYLSLAALHAKTIFFVVIAVLFLGMVVFQLVGYRAGRRRQGREPGAGTQGNSAVEAALFALLGLLVAFTFSAAQDRLDRRRALVVRETDAVGTAYLRLDLLPSEAQPLLREEFRKYVDSRLAYYRELLDLHTASALRQRSDQLQRQIWEDAVLAVSDGDNPTATLLVLPALNEMFDVTTDRDAALRTHMPLAIFGLLAVLAFACAFVVGLGMSKRPRPSQFHILLFAAALALTAYVILNLELPRLGFVRLDAMDTLLYRARAAMD
jgi:hypothetical protein